MSLAVSPLNLERYELKYHVPLSLVEKVSSYIEGFCSLDYHSRISPDGYYVINSLYFDSPYFQILRMKQEDMPVRFSLRVRSYGDKPQPPFFLEIKNKRWDMVNKRRCRIPFQQWSDVLLHPQENFNLDPFSQSVAKEFVHKMTQFCAEPKILTQYRRRAYLSEIDDYARVTFDKCLRFQDEDRYNLYPDERRMFSYDHEDIFNSRGENVILEIKCEARVPFWIRDMIQKFNLTRSAFSKFENSVLSQQAWNLPAPLPEFADRIYGRA